MTKLIIIGTSLLLLYGCLQKPDAYEPRSLTRSFTGEDGRICIIRDWGPALYDYGCRYAEDWITDLVLQVDDDRPEGIYFYSTGFSKFITKDEDWPNNHILIKTNSDE